MSALPQVDLLVVGGGPAGAAAAVAAAREGLSVRLLERSTAHKGKVGEALHPGGEGILAELGAEDALRSATRLRFDGVRVDWAEDTGLQPFGRDARGPWQGYQLHRDAFDEALLDCAADAGAEVVRGVAARDVLWDGERIAGVRTAEAEQPARLVLDASGPARWLGRTANLPSSRRSPPLHVRFGYARRPVGDPNPSLIADSAGWNWLAPVAPDRVQWIALRLDGAAPRPPALDDAGPEGPARGADVTWRVADLAAGPGWFLAGDAAAVLDPTSSRGVLKALTSGLFAGRTAAAILRKGAPEEEAAARYAAWLRAAVERDVAALAALYGRLGAAGFG